MMSKYEAENENLEVQIQDVLKQKVINNKRFLLCHPSKKYWIDFIFQSALNDYTIQYQKREDYTRRISFLIISKDKFFSEYLQSLNISIQTAYTLGIEKHKYFSSKNVFSSIDDKYFFQCNTKHFLEKSSNNQIPDEIPLHYILPISKGYKIFSNINRGARNKIGRYDNKQQPVFYISNGINILTEEKLPNFDHIFIDCTSIDEVSTFNSMPISYFFNSCLDKRIPFLLNKKVDFYNFDPKLIPHLKSKMEKESTSLLENYDVQKLNINYIDTPFDESLEKIFNSINNLRKHSIFSYDLNLVGKLIYTLLNMPISAVKYDLITNSLIGEDSIKSQLREIRESENRYEHDDFEILIKEIDNLLYKYKLDSESPKHNPLLNKICSEYRKGNSIGILSSNKIINLGLKEEISRSISIDIDKLEDNKIYFYNRKKVFKGIEKIKCDVFFSFSASSLDDLQVIQKAEYKKSELYLYVIERVLLQEKLKKMIDSKNCLLEKYDHLKNQQISTYNLYKYFYNKVKLKETDNDYKNINLLDDLKQIKKNENVTIRKYKSYNGINAVKGTCIDFEDNTFIFLSQNSYINILNRNSQKQRKVKFNELEIDQEVIIINSDLRKDLYDIFLEMPDKNGQRLKNISLIERWHNLYEDKYILNKWNDDDLYNKMKINGWNRISKQNLSNWRTKLYYGPQSEVDIICLGKSMRIEEFIKNSKAYYDAMCAIRNEHRQIAKMLNSIIYNSLNEISVKSIEKLDEFNLTLENLKEAIQIKKIINISKETYSVKPSEIGIVYKN